MLRSENENVRRNLLMRMMMNDYETPRNYQQQFFLNWWWDQKISSTNAFSFSTSTSTSELDENDSMSN